MGRPASPAKGHAGESRPGAGETAGKGSIASSQAPQGCAKVRLTPGRSCVSLRSRRSGILRSAAKCDSGHNFSTPTRFFDDLRRML